MTGPGSSPSADDLASQEAHASVLELVADLATSDDLPGLLQRVVRRLADVASVERCSLVLLDEPYLAGTPLPTHATVVAGSDRPGPLSFRLLLADYPELRQAIETGRPVVVDDASRDPLLTHVRAALERIGVSALAVFPVRVGDSITGTLQLRSREPFTGSLAFTLGRSVATAAAIAVRQASLLDDARRSAARLLESRSDLIEHLSDGVALLDADLTVEMLNPAGERLLDLGRTGVLGRRFFDLARPSDIVAERLVRRGLAGGGRVVGTDLEVVLPSGRSAVFAISAGHVKREGRVVLSFRDVTERHRVEHELRRTRDFLERVIDASSDAIIAADLKGKLLVFNPAAEVLFDYPDDASREGLSVRDLYPHGGAEEIMRLLRDSERGQIEAVRAYGRQRNGDLVPIELSAALVRVDGNPVATVGLLRDLRDRVRVEQELARTRQRLVEAEKQAAITALAGATAHELNQPLTVIVGTMELLRKRVDESLRPRLDVVAGEAERMAEIVRRIARLTRIETQHYVGDRVIADFERSLGQASAAPGPGPDHGSGGARNASAGRADGGES